MTVLEIRARVVLAEARAQGSTSTTLIAADVGATSRIPTVADFLRTIETTFTPATARTCRPYWRLAATLLGDRRLVEVTTEELVGVVEDAVVAARERRPDSTGRATRESCCAARRIVFGRATAAGLVAANPATALSKPRRVRSRRRALDGAELTDLIDAVRPLAVTPI